jgi:uncharacterized protein YndB with AHSA1/START domain
MEIHHAMMVRALPDKVYAALTQQSGLAAWLTSKTIAEPRIGSINEFWFDGGKRTLKVEVQALSANQLVIWRLVQGIPPWEGLRSEITWTLTPAYGGTLVDFRQDGWPASDDVYASVSYKWATFMTSLKAYVDNGTGTPAP